MQRQTPIFIVTSSRPRVGKTLVARALTEYFLALRKPVAAFDVNPDEFKLIDYLPGYTAAASINDIRGEMALFDQLVVGDQAPKVVDLSHMLFEKFFVLMQQLNFAREAHRRGVAPMVLFVADPDERSRQGYAMLADKFPDLALVPVLNEAVPQIARYGGNFPPTRRGGPAVEIPALSPVLRSVIEKRTFSFLDYAAKTADGTTELYGWIRRTFVTFRDLEVRLLLGEMPKLPHAPTIPAVGVDDSIASVLDPRGAPNQRRIRGR
jgi:hypothetical protein